MLQTYPSSTKCFIKVAHLNRHGIALCSRGTTNHGERARLWLSGFLAWADPSHLFILPFLTSTEHDYTISRHQNWPVYCSILSKYHKGIPACFIYDLLDGYVLSQESWILDFCIFAFWTLLIMSIVYIYEEFVSPLVSKSDWLRFFGILSWSVK